LIWPVLSSRPAPVVGTTKCPESLCLIGVTSIRETCTASSEDITPRSSLLRTHASIPCSSPLLRLLASFAESSQGATSPCSYRDYPEVISANLSPDAWSPTPTVPPSALACFFLVVIGLPKTLFRSASRWYPRTRFFRGLGSRGCRHFFMFRPPILLASQVAPTAANISAGQPRLLHPGLSCFVASARTGHAIRPNTGN
jgi:hypothetical protein